MPIAVFDFFSGCGGTSKGFEAAGLRPVFALDFDPDAASTYRDNFPDAHVCQADIRKLQVQELEPIIESHRDHATLFCGCAPCQPFTRQNTRKRSEDDQRRTLLLKFGDVIDTYKPDYIFVENVPGIQQIKGNSTLMRFRRRLESLGYLITSDIIESQAYGVPQRRRRLVLLASRHSKVNLPEPTHGPSTGTPYRTVRDSIAHLPPIVAGEQHPTVPNHRAAALSPLNTQRIKATPPEGSRSDWPEDLWLDCHTTSGYSGHTDVYGRMRWDEPATGLTTRCISLSNGRYGHPEQHRAISVREAAALQTFPDNFIFNGPLSSQARQIGNAVPVALAERFGLHIAEHWADIERGNG